MSDVKVFIAERCIDGEYYGETLSARSWHEAQVMCELSGARLDGENPLVVCPVSGKDAMEFIATAGLAAGHGGVLQELLFGSGPYGLPEVVSTTPPRPSASSASCIRLAALRAQGHLLRHWTAYVVYH